MIRQRPFRRDHVGPWEAKHIDCGIYVILMVQLILLNIPLTVLTPSDVHAYRAILAWQVLHPELKVSIVEFMTPNNPLPTPVTQMDIISPP